MSAILAACDGAAPQKYAEDPWLAPSRKAAALSFADVKMNALTATGTASGDDIWVGGLDGAVSHSADRGATWERVEVPYDGSIVAAALDEADLSIWLGTARDGLFHAPGPKGPWATLRPPESDEDLTQLAFVQSSRTLIARSGRQLYARSGTGQWILLRAASACSPVIQMDYNRRTEEIWALTYKQSICHGKWTDSRWSVVTSPTPESLQSIAVDSASRRVAVASDGHVFVSKDGGARWKETPPPGRPEFGRLDEESQLLFLGDGLLLTRRDTRGYPYQSIYQGDTWRHRFWVGRTFAAFVGNDVTLLWTGNGCVERDLSAPIESICLPWMNLSAGFFDTTGNNGWLLSRKGVNATLNGGLDWTGWHSPAIPPTSEPIVVIRDARSKRFWRARGVEIETSTDAETWKHAASFETPDSVTNLALDTRSGRLFAAAGTRLFEGSRDGTAWQSLHTFEQPIYSLTVDANHRTIWVGLQNEAAIYRSSDGGRLWQWVPVLEPGDTVALDFIPRIVVAGTEAPGILIFASLVRDENGVRVYRERDGKLTDLGVIPDIDASIGFDVVFVETAGVLLASSGSKTLLSYDFGRTWFENPLREKFGQGLTLTGPADRPFLVSLGDGSVQRMRDSTPYTYPVLQTYSASLQSASGPSALPASLARRQGLPSGGPADASGIPARQQHIVPVSGNDI